MKKFILLAILVPSLLQAQRLHINLFGGVSNYSGDLQNKQFTLDQSYGAFGAGIQYDLTERFSLLTNFMLAKVGASDTYNKPSLQMRNLSFQSRITEWNLLGEYNLFDLSEKRLTPYVFTGIAVYHFNPYAFDTLGFKNYLQPLSTEGEGLPQYPDHKPYSLTQLAIPFGGGIKLRITENVVIAYEIGFRKLFTDYLDDVSVSYVDKTVLLNAKGPKAVELAYRGGEVKGGNPVYPANGAKRGGPDQKDWYYFTGIRVIIGLDGNQSSFRGNGKNGRTDCPKPVY